MTVLKLVAAVPLFFASLGLGLLFALVGLWSALGFTLLSVVATILLRATQGGGRDHVYFLAFVAALILEVGLLAVVISNDLLGMHKIMDGYAAPFHTQALLALVPVAFYTVSLCLWASKPRQALARGAVSRVSPRAPW